MAEKLQFELVSPQRLLISDQVEMVVVPGADGYFGALPHHAPLLTAVIPGIIDVYQDGAIRDRIFVTGGFAEANEVGCTVLAEEAFPLTELTPELVRQRLDEAEKALADAEAGVAKERAENAMRVAEAMQAAQSGGAGH